MQALIIKILDELRGSWRFRWIGLAVAWFICVAGWFYVFAMPNVYEANARVYVDSQTALGPLLKGLALDPNVESELSVVRQALLSRPNLESVARKTDLDLRAKTPEDREALLASLQQRIVVATDVRSNRSATDGLYRITFQDHNRDKTLAVVETLLNTFVEETLGSKRTGQESAQRFLDDEIGDLERRLTQSEARLADFKKRNVGTMPGDRGDYFVRLQKEIQEASDVRTTLSLAQTRRNELQRQLSGEDPFVFGIDPTTGAGAGGGGGGEAGDITFRIQELESRLEELLLKYTEKHPEVIAVRTTITELKKRQEEELARISSGKRATGSMANSLKTNPVYQSIQTELNRADVQIAELRQELSQRDGRVAELKKLVDTVPEVEAELSRLNRDYEITRTRYLELVERRETAKLSESADKQGVVKFQIIDPPLVGLEPVAPKRALLMAAVLIVGLGVGAALTYLMNQLRPVYQNVRVLAEKTGLPVLGCVSRTWPELHRAERRQGLLAFSGAVSLLAVVGIAVTLWSEAGARLAQRILGQA
jgi:polysaccharide chain length determinant protein (PEP-CTERM system associated)